MTKKKYLSVFFALMFLFIALFHTGCTKIPISEQEQTNFDSFLNDLFVSEVRSDTLSLNYSLESPEDYGIEYTETTLGEYSVARMNEGLSLSENYLQRLITYDYDLLTPKQQLTYHILKKYLERDINFGNYLYYNECLGPTTGIQAQLPILLAEYSFYEKKDIDQYIELLSCVYDYFEDIIQYEREKSKMGLFMSDDVAERIMDQMEAFIKTPEDNFLIEYFNEKISKFDGLSDKEIKYYKKANKEAVLNKIIPAYEMLVDVLLELKGTGTNSSGLYYYPEGQAYYECLANYKTGSDRSMEEIATMLDDAINDGIFDITKLSISDKLLLDKYMSFTSFPLTDPVDIINDLKKDITKDFPETVKVNCDIKYVHESLADYLSPAMYLVPPIDNYKNNHIYINGNDPKTLSMIYTTVAHEGYPGHLYQCVYFRNQNPSPIRNVMNFLGYDEGWATYVEMYSYKLAGIDENLAAFLKTNTVVILCMYARADIGIHYEGWTENDTVNYISDLIGDTKTAEIIYRTLLEEPAIYLPYAVGYLEIMELREKAEKELGEHFKIKDFHKFLLDIGPAQFSVIDEYLQEWINQYQQ
ncbi:MAG: hypothetical protein K0S76_1857 [Herbinix sp.]|nr:hypothetical protein [Herbinix sp.]